MTADKKKPPAAARTTGGERGELRQLGEQEAQPADGSVRKLLSRLAKFETEIAKGTEQLLLVPADVIVEQRSS
jgi:hypothetical protein